MSPIRVVFFGTPDFSAHGLRALIADARYSVVAVVTQPDRPAGRGKAIQQSAVKQVALERAIPVLQPESVKREGQNFIDTLSKYGPFDIGVVIAFGQILPSSLLSLPLKGCVNVHASLLPRWRGAAPIQRAIMAQDKQTGVCLMQMEAGLDTGPVYSQAVFQIEVRDNFSSLHDKLAAAGAQLLCQDLARIVNSEIIAVTQAQEGVTYASKIGAAEALIDWSLPAVELSARIRGLSPSPGAFTYLDKKRLKILDAQAKQMRAVSTSGILPKPGQIVTIDNNLLEVCSGQGVLELAELQLEGRKKLAVAEFLKGVPLSTQTVLGT